MIRVAPSSFAPWTADSPTTPSPTTATVSPGLPAVVDAVAERAAVEAVGRESRDAGLAGPVAEK